MKNPSEFLQGDFEAESTGARKRFTPTIGGMAKLALAGVVAISLSGCFQGHKADRPGNTNQTVLGVLGAGGGALAGSLVGKGKGNIAAMVLGGIGGMLLGAEVGQRMDRADWEAMKEAERQAVRTPAGNKIVWENRNTGNYGSVTPVRDGHNTSGQYCREYQTKVVVGGKIHEGYGTACRQPDGSWKVSALEAPLGRDFAEIDFDDNGAPILESGPATRFG